MTAGMFLVTVGVYLAVAIVGAGALGRYWYRADLRQHERQQARGWTAGPGGIPRREWP